MPKMPKMPSWTEEEWTSHYEKKAQDLESYYEEKRLRLERRQSLSTITPSTDSHAHFQSRTLNQSQSPLLEKLPLEIRSRIWEYSLDFGEPLHIAQGDHPRERQFRIVDCERMFQEMEITTREHPKYIEEYGHPTDNMPHGRCYHVYYPNYTYSNGIREDHKEWHALPTLSHEKWRPLSLLRSCRRIYTEAINLLYSLNTFEFYLGLDVVHFASIIPAERSSSITSVTLYGDIGNLERGNRNDFRRVLTTLKSWTSLEKVRHLSYAYLNDLVDQHSYWFNRKLAKGRTFKKGLWREYVDSYHRDFPEDWRDFVLPADGESDEDTDENEGESKGEKRTLTKRLHYSKFEKYRTNEIGKVVDYWCLGEGGNVEVEYSNGKLYDAWVDSDEESGNTVG